MATAERFQQRLQEYSKALVQLEKALGQPEDEYMRDAVIQRFEFSYELAWKALKLYLAMKDIDVRNARDTLAAALQQGLIVDGSAWSELHRMRNQTSHTYDQELALTIYQYLKSAGIVHLQKLQVTLDGLWSK